MIDMIHEVEIEKLQLDLENPRFGLSDANDEFDALRILRQRANLKELWDSISEKGFERYEPLVAFPNAEKLIVVEGNRRLAAARLLRNPTLAEQIGVRSLPEVSSKIFDQMNTLPIYIVNNRHEADNYIGFKHINGPATWGSLAKARFAVGLFERLGQLNNDEKIRKLSRRLGDSRQLLLRMLVGYRVFEQARKLEFIDENQLEKHNFDFSHLYTILQNPDTREYLGLSREPLNENHVVGDPIPESHHQKLSHLIDWLFGRGERASLIRSQGTDRPKLAKILGNVIATETLEQTRDFDRAADEAGFNEDKWHANVTQLESLAKRISDGVSDLPEQIDREQLTRSRERLTKANRHLRSAEGNLKEFYPDD